ncbi:hypothetical protein Q4Q40_22050 [Flavivirga jejuensis]|uniref:Uncharacterized protein n=2 Tax=Flavivirga jejuensis TaxID=870487 RepID=A0ABT8WUN3_9FLAO|nr:hypothetical protein [Flavivirga jejuensis]MDO5976893.1 hypothetical protein [Flavivirga jejuensis]
MQIETLNKICEAHNIKLSEFFKKVEEKYSKYCYQIIPLLIPIGLNKSLSDKLLSLWSKPISVINHKLFINK